MALLAGGLDRLATMAGAAISGVLDTAREVGDAGRYVSHTFGCPAGLRGVAMEWTSLIARLAVYPAGLAREQLCAADDGYRTDTLPPARRGLVITDPTAAGTPILLLHGIMDNRSAFTVFRRALRRRGFGHVHAVNYSLLTGDVRAAARQLGRHVEQLLETTGAERVHIVGHSLGGVIARYYVQRMGGDEHVDTLVTLGSPHSGTYTAYMLPTPLARQLRPGTELMRELTLPAPGCRTRFLVVWSRLDEIIVPQRNARLSHSDLDIDELEMCDVGHLSLPVDPRSVHWVASVLARSDHEVHSKRAGRHLRRRYTATLSNRSAPAS